MNTYVDGVLLSGWWGGPIRAAQLKSPEWKSTRAPRNSRPSLPAPTARCGAVVVWTK